MRVKIVKDDDIKEIYDCFLAIWQWYNKYYDVNTDNEWNEMVSAGKSLCSEKGFPVVGKRLIPTLLSDVSDRIEGKREKIPKKARSLIFSEFWYLYKRYYYPVQCEEWKDLCLCEMNLTSQLYKDAPLMSDLIKFVLKEIDRKNVQRH